MTLYNIVRHYLNENKKARIIDTHLTLEEAQAHCRDPETSSKTATSEEARKHTRINGPWFDGYTEAK